MGLLFALSVGAAISALGGAACSLKAAKIKGKCDPLYDALEHGIGARPDNLTGDAMAHALIGREDSRIATQNAAMAAPWNQTAASFAIISALMSLGAGLLAIN